MNERSHDPANEVILGAARCTAVSRTRVADAIERTRGLLWLSAYSLRSARPMADGGWERAVRTTSSISGRCSMKNEEGKLVSEKLSITLKEGARAFRDSGSSMASWTLNKTRPMNGTSSKNKREWFLPCIATGPAVHTQSRKSRKTGFKDGGRGGFLLKDEKATLSKVTVNFPLCIISVENFIALSCFLSFVPFLFWNSFHHCNCKCFDSTFRREAEVKSGSGSHATPSSFPPRAASMPLQVCILVSLFSYSMTKHKM